MRSPKQVHELVVYWIGNAREKRKTMDQLYASKRYADALFFGHLVLECALKALVVRTTRDHAPRTHNLLELARHAGVQLDSSALALLAEVNEFNQAGRYPDQKFSFYKLCTKSYADRYYRPIINLYEQLCPRAMRSE